MQIAPNTIYLVEYYRGNHVLSKYKVITKGIHPENNLRIAAVYRILGEPLLSCENKDTAFDINTGICVYNEDFRITKLFYP